MITIHHLGVSQSERIIWLFEELGLPYELKLYTRDPQTRLAPPQYKALHPMGTAPVITDGDVVLAESGAIIEYVIGKYGNGRLALPPPHKNFADYLYWFHFANGTMMPAQLVDLVVAWTGAPTDDPTIRGVCARTGLAWAQVEKRLGEVPYFAGAEFTAADIMMFFSLSTVRLFTPTEISKFPNTRAYLKRIGERPAYQRAMAKGDPEMAPVLS